MATVKPLILSSAGRITVIQSGDTIDPSLITGGGPTGPTGPSGGGGGGPSNVLNVRVASVVDVTISAPGAAIDGVTMANGETVLLKNQTAGAENGVYVFNGAASAMTRSTGLDISAEAVTGLLVTVAEGTASNTVWMLTTPQPITLGTTALTFSLFGGSIVTELTVDFGTIPCYAKQFTVTMNGLQVGQRIFCQPSGNVPAGQYFDEYEFGPVMWVGKCSTINQLTLLGSSMTPLRGEWNVLVYASWGTSMSFVAASNGLLIPDYALMGNNIF